MKRYKLTLEARRDLEDIARYTKRRWGKKQRDLYIGRLKLRIEWLAENPRLGKKKV
jgi:toxin ParE1/3/4